MLVVENEGDVCNREIFNVGSAKNETSIRELAELMRSIYAENHAKEGDKLPDIADVSEEEFYGKGYEDCDRRIPNVDKMKSHFNWDAKHNMNDTVYKSMKYWFDK